MKSKPLVSIVIPTKNTGAFLDACLKSMRDQTYKNIEMIIVDGNSTDNTLPVAKKYHAKVFQYDPKIAIGKMDAPYRRNYGVKKSSGKYVWYADADFKPAKKFIENAVALCEKGFDAVIYPFDTIGTGVWTMAKQLERRAYFGDDTVESPRFFRKSAWVAVGGLDESLGGGGDDWDLYQKLLDKNYKVGRTKTVVQHMEGEIKISKLFKKSFMYGQDALKYIKKRPKKAFQSYFPIRPGYVRNWKLFVQRPKDTFFLIIARVVEYTGGALGIAYSLLFKSS
ncbi:MAG TPA: glycosyltransferase family A protein [Patescibacteria group bacterium]|nr:glycosyltransferase family A protein [Patescibacteria group bacterium]